MNSENPNKFIITYSNYLEFEGVKLAFRKSELFDITNTPSWIPLNESAQCWIIKRRQLSKKKAQELVIKSPIQKDVSDLQWYQQEQLNGVFNLK